MGVAPFRAVIGWVLVALLLLSSGCGRLGRQASPSQPADQPLAPTAPRGALQEVAPPQLVQDLRTRLDQRNPQVLILAPADGALLPAGPWSLELQVQDWPLADAGPLGLGPHLVVQLDDAPPLRISDATAARHLAMPPLNPGSHRLTVYAARPWGEVVKSPGASRQIRLDRVAANPQQVPAPGSPQLLAAPASPGPSQEPVLIDWLLIDAPLQHLRDDDGRWRVRVSVNGDSFLVDRQTPLWLQGFHGGSNAVQLELLDGRGEPLNPPFNSLMEEVVIQAGPAAAWQRPSLTALEQAQLLGEAPLPPEPRPAPSPAPPEKDQEQGLDQPNSRSSDPPVPPATQPAPDVPTGAKGLQTDQSASVSSESLSAPGQGTQPETLAPSQAAATVESNRAPEPALVELAPPTVGLDSIKAPQEPASPGPPKTSAPGLSAPIPAQTPTSATPTTPANGGAETPIGPPPRGGSLPQAGTAPPPPPDRLSPSTSLSGRARDQVAADGSLLKPRPEGPLARLRQRFQP